MFIIVIVYLIFVTAIHLFMYFMAYFILISNTNIHYSMLLKNVTFQEIRTLMSINNIALTSTNISTVCNKNP